MDDFEAVLRAADAAMTAAVVTGVTEACEDLLSNSRDEVPLDQMDLSNSGKVTVAANGDRVEGAVSYDTPYAVIQHEAPDFEHQDGRKAGYLRDPQRALADKHLKYIASKAEGALGGG